MNVNKALGLNFLTIFKNNLLTF